MKNGLLVLVILLSALHVTASEFEVKWQKENLKILFRRDEYDNGSSKKLFYVTDTLTRDTTLLDKGNSDWYNEDLVFFQEKYIVAKMGDMKDIFTLKGKILFKSAHCYKFNKEYNTITAWLCGAGWILADINGDILFYDKERTRMIDMNYMPNINNKIFAAKILSLEKKKVCYGYMNQKGEWVIEPVFDNATEFDETNTATVQQNNRTFKIDINRNEIK